MSASSWPEPLPTIRTYLPAEMRVLDGLGGFIGGGVLFTFIFSTLLGGNWQLGFGDDRILTAISLVFVPALIGLLSPIWFWIGRPLWVRFDRPGDHVLSTFERANFLLGLVGSLGGIWLVLQVRATSPLLEQSLALFGLAIAIASPLWYWVIRPLGSQRLERWLPGNPTQARWKTRLSRLVPMVGLLILGSVAITSFISLPVGAVGDPISADGLTVSVTETTSVSSVTELDSGEEFGQHSAGLLLVHVTVDNRGETSREIPGASVGEIWLISPACQAQTFGEPANNCNRAYVHGDVSTNGETFGNFDDQQERLDGVIEPGESLEGWLVFRIESSPDPTDSNSMLIIENVGRWPLEPLK